jgi:iron(III) transport system permease protein
MQTIKNHKVESVTTWLIIFMLSFPLFLIVLELFEYLLINFQDAGNLFSSRSMSLLGRSISLSVMVSLVVLIISLPLAYIYSYYRFPLKRISFILTLLPFFIPPYIFAISWINLCGKDGLLQILNINIFGFWGSVFVLSCWLYPLALFFFLSSIKISSRLKEAANLFAGKIQTLNKIILPLVSSGLTAGIFFTFILAITNFSVPGALRLNVFPNEIFIQYGAFFNHQNAIILSFPLLLLATLIILLVRGVYMKKSYRKIQQNENAVLKRLSGNKLTVWYFFIFLLLVTVLILPLISLIVGIGSYNVLFTTFLDTLPEILNSLLYGLLTAVILTIIGLFLAYYRMKVRRNWIKIFMDVLIVLQIAIPGTVFGIILIHILQLFPMLEILSNPFPVMILSNFRYLAVSYFICIAGLSVLPEKYLEVAKLTSSGEWKNFRKILFPLIKNSLFGSIIIVFILSFGELDAAILISPPGFETLPLRIYSLLHYGANDMVYTLSLLQVIIIYCIIMFGFKWIHKSLRIYA